MKHKETSINIEGHLKRGMKENLKNSRLQTKNMELVGEGKATNGALEAVEIEAAISACKHVYAVWNHNESAKEALVAFGKESAGAAGKGALVGAMSVGFKQALTNSSSQLLPVMAATIAFEVGTSLNKLCKGQLTPMECIDEIRNKSIPLAGSIIGASVGQTLIPVPILGAMVGSMIGSAIASFGYGLCLEMLNMEQSVAASHAHLEQVRRECAMMKAQIEQSRQQMRQIAGQYFYEYLTTFNQAFEMMDKAVVADNIDEFIQANNLIVQQCGGKVQFNDMDGFMDIMNNNLPIEF